MTKNQGHFQAFNDKWFAKHQKALLTLLNHRLTRRWFRWVLRIRQCDCQLNVAINRIQPNAFTFGGRKVGDRIELTTDFRTHPKFGKRLYYAFKPIWWVVHFWDWAIADRFIPRLSYGFDSLTVYPDPHTETTSVDGYVRRNGTNLTWADIRDGAGTEFDDSATTLVCAYLTAGTTTDRWNDFYRSIILFDTSALTAGVSISAATLSIFGINKANVGSPAVSPTLNIYTSTPASNTALQSSDFQQLGTVAQCDTPINQAGWSIVAYNDFILNSAGRGNISKTGVSKFGMRDASYDVPNSPPTWNEDITFYFFGVSADTALTTTDPKLVVTYTISSASATGNFFIF